MPKPKLTPDEIQAVGIVIGLVGKDPPNDDLWDTAEKHGPHLVKRLNDWLKEQLGDDCGGGSTTGG